MKKVVSMKGVLALTAAMSLTVSAAAQDVPEVSDPAASPAQAAAPAPAPDASADGAFQVVRPGDSQMSCEALIAEANALNDQLTQAQNAMSERAMDMARSQLRGMQAQQAASTAMNLGGMAASLIPGAGLALGAAQSVAGVAQRAAAAAQQQQQLQAMDDMIADTQAATETLMPLMNRADHLTDLSIAKGC